MTRGLPKVLFFVGIPGFLNELGDFLTHMRGVPAPPLPTDRIMEDVGDSVRTGYVPEVGRVFGGYTVVFFPPPLHCSASAAVLAAGIDLESGTRSSDG